MTTTLVASGGTAAPLQTLLQPAAASCAGLPSGRYRALNPNEPDPKWANHVFEFNAETLKATYWDATSATLVDQGGCSFSIAGGSQVRVRKSGLTIMRDTPPATPTKTQVSLVIPEQVIALSELAGTWSGLSYERNIAGGPLKPNAVLLTLGAAGQFSAGSDCLGLAACTAWTGLPGDLTASGSGGFQFTGSGGAIHKIYAFQTAVIRTAAMLGCRRGTFHPVPTGRLLDQR